MKPSCREDRDMLESTDREIATITRIVLRTKSPILTSNVERSVEISNHRYFIAKSSHGPGDRKLSTIRGMPAFGKKSGAGILSR